MGWQAAMPAIFRTGGALGAAYLGRQKAPTQAAYQNVDVNKGVAEAVSVNQKNFKDASNLAAKTNAFDQKQASSLLEQALPGFAAVQQRLMQQVNTDLDNQYSMPKEMQDSISRFAAEKGITRGTAGNFNSFSLIKDFGFNLTDWSNAKRTQALNTLSTVYGMTPRVNPMSPMSMFVNPQTTIGVQMDNNKMQYNVAQAGYNAQAAASNYNRSLMANSWQQAHEAWAQAFEGPMGKGGMGGGGGGGGGGGMAGGLF